MSAGVSINEPSPHFSAPQRFDFTSSQRGALDDFTPTTQVKLQNSFNELNVFSEQLKEQNFFKLKPLSYRCIKNIGAIVNSLYQLALSGQPVREDDFVFFVEALIKYRLIKKERQKREASRLNKLCKPIFGNPIPFRLSAAVGFCGGVIAGIAWGVSQDQFEQRWVLKTLIYVGVALTILGVIGVVFSYPLKEYYKATVVSKLEIRLQEKFDAFLDCLLTYDSEGCRQTLLQIDSVDKIFCDIIFQLNYIVTDNRVNRQYEKSNYIRGIGRSSLVSKNTLSKTKNEEDFLENNPSFHKIYNRLIKEYKAYHIDKCQKIISELDYPEFLIAIILIQNNKEILEIISDRAPATLDGDQQHRSSFPANISHLSFRQDAFSSDEKQRQRLFDNFLHSYVLDQNFEQCGIILEEIKEDNELSSTWVIENHLTYLLTDQPLAAFCKGLASCIENANVENANIPINRSPPDGGLFSQLSQLNQSFLNIHRIRVTPANTEGSIENSEDRIAASPAHTDSEKQETEEETALPV